MSKLRTFIAVEVSSSVRKRALELIERLHQSEANVKWVGAAELHWTLKFLGDVETNDLPATCDAVARAAAAIPSFEITAAGAGAFPEALRPRTIWLGVTHGADAFIALHQQIETELATLGFRQEQRRFHPHMTIGRVRRSLRGLSQLGRLVAEHNGFSAGDMSVAEVVVFSSRLEPHGPSYTVLSRANLQA